MKRDRPMLLRHDNKLFMSQSRQPVDAALVTGDDIHQAQQYTDKLEAENERLCDGRAEQDEALRLRLRAVEAIAWVAAGQTCPHRNTECGRRLIQERLFNPVQCVMCLIEYGLESARETIDKHALCEEVADTYWEAIVEKSRKHICMLCGAEYATHEELTAHAQSGECEPPTWQEMQKEYEAPEEGD